jgi:hypothetical protein
MRNSRQRWLLAVLVATMIVVATRHASAFCRTTTCDPTTAQCEKDQNGCVGEGAPLTWQTMPIVYRIFSGGSEKLDMDATRGIVKAAFDTWAAVECDGGKTSLRFVEQGDVTSDKPDDALRAPEPFGIYFRDASWTHDDADESLALTNQLYGLITGLVEYADIEINTHDNEFSTSDNGQGIDLQSVITHEAGHYIGLAHSRAEDSIMVARYCQSGVRCGGGVDKMRALADDDVAAVCALYPPGGPGGVHYPDPQSKGCAASSSTRTSAPAFGFVALFSALIRAFRRRGNFRR